MTDNEIIQNFKERVDFLSSVTSVYLDEDEGLALYQAAHSALELINRKCSEIEALTARTAKQEATLDRLENEKALLQGEVADAQAVIETQSQNFNVLVSDHRCLQQSFDNLKGLYQAEKEKVESAKSNSIYFAKELQKARAEINRVTALAAEWKDAAYTYADNIDKIKAEAIKEFAERLIIVDETTAINCATNEKVVRVTDIDNLVKEMVGDSSE
jgi:chromosome segregation ATPase